MGRKRPSSMEVNVGDRRSKKARRQRNRKKKEKDPEKEGNYRTIRKENALFEKYYQGQGLIPEGEWDQFMSTVRENLPVTFRITGTRSLAESVRGCLEQRFFAELSGLEVEGERVPPPQPIPWYPTRLAWQLQLSRKVIRKSPLLSKFHAFLVRENEQGNISRQEAVSMIPPLLLDVQPWHKVLDMCAAPGSKTAQLIEFLHAEDTPTSSIPSGVVVANDADNRRCYMLVHQTKRLNSPAFMVTNHDASVFPVLYYHDHADVRHPLYYDRVLCDVPCSGDGTLRKNPIIWRQWNPGQGPALHKLQLRILNRGLELLSPGGRLVYSTCSLNPVEDEAVIAGELGLCRGTVELVDCSDMLPGLKRVPGVSSWKVMSKGGAWVSADALGSSGRLLSPTMFPPAPEQARELRLERCMRVFPHLQDSGGFFVAVLHKKAWLPWQKQSKLAAPRTTEQTSVQQEEAEPPSSSSVEQRTSVQDQVSGEVAVREPESTSPALDTGSQAQDTGSQAQDTGNEAQDTGNEAQDTGSQAQDTGNEPQDTGSQAQVTAATAITESQRTTGQDTTVSRDDQGVPMEVGPGEEAATPSAVGDCVPTSKLTATAEEQASAQVEPVGESETREGEAESISSSAVDTGVGVSSAGGTAAGTGEETACSGEGSEGTVQRPPASILGRPGFQQRGGRSGFKEDPYVFLQKDNDVFQAVRPHFGLPEDFPSEQLLTRSLVGKKRNIYLASRLVRELTKRNEKSIKIINIGVKVLARCEQRVSSCGFRLCQEGIEAIAPFVSSHCVCVSVEDLACLLQEANPLTSSLSQKAQEDVRSLGMGPVLFKYMPDGETTDLEEGATQRVTFRCPIYLSGWVAARSVRLYVDRKYRYHFLAILGYDPPENQSLETVSGKRRDKDEEASDCEASPPLEEEASEDEPGFEASLGDCEKQSSEEEETADAAS